MAVSIATRGRTSSSSELCVCVGEPIIYDISCGMAPHLSSELASSQAWLFYMLGRGAQGQALFIMGKKSGHQAAVGFLTVHC